MRTSVLTAAALQAKIRAGERCGKLRYGYELAPDGKRLVPVPFEQRTIALLRHLRASGKTYRELVESLREQGIKTKSGGTNWKASTIHRILTRPIA
jgi:hypothetical protein